jgi:hypothetical protein
LPNSRASRRAASPVLVAGAGPRGPVTRPTVGDCGAARTPIGPARGVERKRRAADARLPRC